MKKSTVILILLISVSFSLTIHGQTNENSCDTIYDFVENMPKYENDLRGLNDYFFAELGPIILNCINRDSILVASMYLTLTIDQTGKVIEVVFERIHATDQCKAELRQKILKMTGWTAGQKDDQPVCCRFKWPVSCIKIE